MSESFEIIRARTKDDAAILIDRLMKSKHQEVVLVLPKNSILTADLNSLKILKEEAESIGKTLSISTESDEIKKFAEKIQLSVFDSAPIMAEKKIKRMLDIIRPPLQELEPEPKLEPEQELEPQIEPIAEPVVVYEAANKNDLEKNLEDFYNDQPLDKLSSKKFFSFNRVIKALAVIGVLLLVSAMYLVLPKASIRLSLKEMPVSATISVAVSKNISTPDFASGIIPGQYFLLTKSGSKIIETSNETVNIPSKYGGNIDIYNAYSTAAQKLVAQTRFETKDGKVFRIQNPIIIPGAKMSGSNLTPSFIKVEVISDAVGEEYQIGPSFFTIPGFNGTAKFAGFYAKSTEMMTPKGESAMANQDMEKTKKDLENTLVTELKNEVLNTFKDSDLRLIDGASTVKVDEFKIASNVATMKISWQAIFFKEKDFKSLVNYFISAKYPDLKNFDFKDRIAYPQAVKSDFKKGETFFTFNFNKSNAFTADLAGLKKELVGLDETGMRNIISDKNFIKSATISLWPFWVRQAPGNPEKINIILDE